MNICLPLHGIKYYYQKSALEINYQSTLSADKTALCPRPRGFQKCQVQNRDLLILFIVFLAGYHVAILHPPPCIRKLRMRKGKQSKTNVTRAYPACYGVKVEGTSLIPLHYAPPCIRRVTS